jgi:hypothetical protein
MKRIVNIWRTMNLMLVVPKRMKSHLKDWCIPMMMFTYSRLIPSQKMKLRPLFLMTSGRKNKVPGGPAKPDVQSMTEAESMIALKSHARERKKA